ncbi:MAG: c-type cytochrome [Burkholderiaceae bacterium]
MSNPQGHTEAHSSPIKTPKQLAVIIALSFIVPVILLIMLANVVTFGTKGSSGSDAFSPQATSARIAPVAGYEYVDAKAPKVFKTGEQIFAQVCTSCHTAGVAGAPKVGDNAGWAPLIKTGLDEMVKIAIAGKGGMPPKGGNPALSDYEIARAVVYMANKSGGSFEEPAAPAPEGGATPEGGKPAAASAAAGTKPAATNGTPAAAATTKPADATAGTAPAASAGGTAAAGAPAAAGGAPAATASAGTAAAGASTAAVNPAGEKLYKTVCLACHASGVANAPKFGDKAAWAPYIATGMDTMVKVAIAGKGAMPPKGGAMNASEDDIRAAVQYMVDAAK